MLNSYSGTLDGRKRSSRREHDILIKLNYSAEVRSEEEKSPYTLTKSAAAVMRVREFK
jgi:hypothetical protein